MDKKDKEILKPLSLNKIVVLKELREQFMKAWGKDTMFTEDKKYWNPNVPSIGQCYITAMIVQDFLGGDVYRSTCQSLVLDGDNIQDAYFNVIDGHFVDLGIDEYGEPNDIWPILSKPVKVKRLNRKNKRYLLLKSRLNLEEIQNKVKGINAGVVQCKDISLPSLEWRSESSLSHND